MIKDKSKVLWINLGQNASGQILVFIKFTMVKKHWYILVHSQLYLSAWNKVKQLLWFPDFPHLFIFSWLFWFQFFSHPCENVVQWNRTYFFLMTPPGGGVLRFGCDGGVRPEPSTHTHLQGWFLGKVVPMARDFLQKVDPCLGISRAQIIGLLSPVV